MKTDFDHETLHAYLKALESGAWSETLLERVLKVTAVHAQLDSRTNVRRAERRRRQRQIQGKRKCEKE